MAKKKARKSYPDPKKKLIPRRGKDRRRQERRAVKVRLVDVYTDDGTIPGAVELLYQILEERPHRANIVHASMPTPEQHEYFVGRRPYRAWYLIENERGERVGELHLTNRNEIALAILESHRRKGYGEAAIRLVLESIPPLPGLPAIRRSRYSANVAPANAPSRGLFEKLGGRLLQVTYEL
jgi:GNAT superfamily N-acetyltransferase